MTTILSPAKGFTGTTTYGPFSLAFEDGKATTDNLPDGVRHYLLANGYTVDGDQPVELTPTPAVNSDLDSRDVTGVQIGAPLRDASVDPQPGDFLGPVGAGQHDPQGPLVANPGIHAEGERIVRPGPVGAPRQQDADEKAHAEALLIDQRQAVDADLLAVPDFLDRESGGINPDKTGPLGLSDPGSEPFTDPDHPQAGDAAAGDELRNSIHGQAELGQIDPGDPSAPSTVEPNRSEPGDDSGAPKGNASRDEWVEYARTQGASDDELKPLEEGGLSRDDLRGKFGA